jgi:hypothetical protein
LLDQFFNCKTGSTGTSDAVSYDLFQLPLPLGLSTFDLLGADKCARPLMALQQTSKLEFPICPDHGVRIDGQINRKLAHRGELVAYEQ